MMNTGTNNTDMTFEDGKLQSLYTGLEEAEAMYDEAVAYVETFEAVMSGEEPVYSLETELDTYPDHVNSQLEDPIAQGAGSHFLLDDRYANPLEAELNRRVDELWSQWEDVTGYDARSQQPADTVGEDVDPDAYVIHERLSNLSDRIEEGTGLRL